MGLQGGERGGSGPSVEADRPLLGEGWVGSIFKIKSPLWCKSIKASSRLEINSSTGLTWYLQLPSSLGLSSPT